MAQRAGRPRSEAADRAILEAAFRLVSAHGFRSVTVDQIAAEAGVGKMTIYRRWPNKAAIVMDALLETIGAETDFPSAPTALKRLRKQLDLQAKFFRSDRGRLIRSLVAEAQADEELSIAFRDRWLRPRREGVLRVIQMAVQEGDLRKNMDSQAAIDSLYGPIYYRLLLRTGPIDKAFLDSLYDQFLHGHQINKRRA